MNNLDALLQSITKRADAQTARSAGQSVEAGDVSGEAADQPAFDALLRTFSNGGMQGKAPAPGQSEGGARLPILNPGAAAQTVGISEGRLQESRDDEPTSGQEAAPDNLVNDRLFGSEAFLLPQAGPQTSGIMSLQGGPAGRTEAGVKQSPSLLDLIRIPTEEMKDTPSLQELGVPSSRKASVLHQEAHFKPIFAEVAQPVAKPLGSPMAQVMPGTEVAVQGPDIAGDPEVTGSLESDGLLSQKSGETHAQSATVSNEKGSLDASQSNSVIQRIADSIVADAKRSAPEASVRSHRPEYAIPTQVKASDGVLRVLDIQLRPAELGLVTVKMRLSGDTLEMELHASRSETADLLRKDSETLSNLLRTSGYRPDVITIHASGLDAPQQDNGFSQRQASMSHAGSQFGGSHGGGAGHDRQPERGADEIGESNQGGRRNEAREISAGNRSADDLYL